MAPPMRQPQPPALQDLLPDHLLELVLAAARDAGCRSATLRRVCKRWTAAHDLTLTELALSLRAPAPVSLRAPVSKRNEVPGSAQRQRRVADVARTVQRFASNLRSLTLRKLSREEVAAALPAPLRGSLQSLALHACDGGSDGEAPGGAWVACSALQQLTLEFDRFQTRWQPVAAQLHALTGLRSLSLTLPPTKPRGDCEALATALAPLAPSLTRLALRTSCGCSGDLSGAVCSLTALRELSLMAVDRLTVHTSALAALSAMQRLHVSAALDGPLGQLSALQHLTSLHHGNVRVSDDEAARLAELSTLGALVELSLRKLHGPAAVPHLAGLPHLRTLHLYAWGSDLHWRPQDVRGLACLTQLQVLELADCNSWRDLAPLSTLTALTTLSLCGCSSLTSLQGLGSLTQLAAIKLQRCHSLSALEPLGGLGRLEQLTLDCSRVSSLEGLQGLTRLRDLRLDASGSSQIASLAPLSGLIGLQHLDLAGFRALRSCEGLAPLTGVRRLCLAECRWLADLAALSGLVQLQQLEMFDCARVTCLGPLSGLGQLEDLSLDGCRRITSLQPLSRLMQLHRLSADYCRRITSLEPLRGLSQLRKLSLDSCLGGTDLSPLGALPCLSILAVRNGSARVQAQAQALMSRRYYGGVDNDDDNNEDDSSDDDRSDDDSNDDDSDEDDSGDETD